MKVLSFGELLLRLTAPGYTKLFQRDSLDASFCGAEANVAASLAVLGMDSAFFTVLPSNDVGTAAENSLRYFGVDTGRILRGSGRMGLYYLEKGISQRPGRAIYDRAYSAIALARREDFDWKRILEGISWFHWTGINPALSENMVDICMDACRSAKSLGITVSCDLNYRKTLWTCGKAQAVMPKFMEYVDVCIANEEDAELALGIRMEDNHVGNGQLNEMGYIRTSEELSGRYGIRYVATTLRKSYSASRNGWGAVLYDAKNRNAFFSEEYDIQIVDRVGGGDSFAAGLIYALANRMENQEAISFATAASCLKQTMEGDYNRATVSDIQMLLRTGGNGRVQR